MVARAEIELEGLRGGGGACQGRVKRWGAAETYSVPSGRDESVAGPGVAPVVVPHRDLHRRLALPVSHCGEDGGEVAWTIVVHDIAFERCVYACAAGKTDRKQKRQRERE